MPSLVARTQLPSTRTQSINSNHNRRPYFSPLSGDALDEFNQLGMEVSYARGGSLFQEGQLPQYVFVVISGKVKISVSSRDGKVVILRIAQPGDFLGVSSALSGTPHEVTAEAVETCQVRAIRVGAFLSFLQAQPEAAMQVTQCVLREYQMVFNNICRLTLPTTVAGRLANLLLEWLKTRFDSTNKAGRLTVALTHTEIAGMTGTTRETVSRVLQQFQREKLIEVKGTCLTVLQPEVLAEMAV